jgi:hypothetical protein
MVFVCLNEVTYGETLVPLLLNNWCEAKRRRDKNWRGREPPLLVAWVNNYACSYALMHGA